MSINLIGRNWEESNSSLRHKMSKILNCRRERLVGGTVNWTALYLHFFAYKCAVLAEFETNV